VSEPALTHCKHGHPYDAANTYFRRDNGMRECRECRNARARKFYQRRYVSDRNLAAAIYRELTNDRAAHHALELWRENTGLGWEQQMQRVLLIVATDAIETVLSGRVCTE
jgi:hypothetical protein